MQRPEDFNSLLAASPTMSPAPGSASRRLFGVFTDAGTYRGLLFLATAIPFGAIGLSVLFAGWTVTAVVAITPAIVPALMAFGGVVWLLASAESTLARELLGADTAPLRRPSSRGFWRRAGAVLADRGFWKAQAYLLLRSVVGWPLAIAEFTLLAVALGWIAAPIYYRWIPKGEDGGIIDFHVWQADTQPKALLLVPAGLVLLVVAMHLARLFAALWRGIGGALLGGSMGADASATAMRNVSAAASREARRNRLTVHAAVVVGLNVGLVLVWSLTWTDYFWPVWSLLPLGHTVALHGWILLLDERPTLWRRKGISYALAVHLGVSTSLFLLQVAIWALSGGGYFWPVWPLLGLAIVAFIHWSLVLLRGPDTSELTRRIEHLQTTRAGAVDLQEADFRRIERDLHDGAQARLVALGMSLGMAEQKFEDDPGAARELVAEARLGVGEALRELRDLARGIRPPVLADRGLEAAIIALADRSPLSVNVGVDVGQRPADAVETAAYFVVAETLTNAGKHAQATRIDVSLARRGDLLVIDIVDDGRGGADPGGGGLSGLRRRVEALDGRLTVTSPPGGPTVVHAELPCAS